MEPTPDRFRALARSGPWRWRTLEVRFVEGTAAPAEASLDRARGTLVVRDPRGIHHVAAAPHSAPGRPWAVTPALDADGLVASRPTHATADRRIDYADAMWQSYLWVAVLDPVELSSGVLLDDLRAGEVAGRSVWWARAVPVEGYDPTCSCCPLLWSRVSDRLEYGEERDLTGIDYPSAHDVALDLGTGAVVRVVPLDGDRRGAWSLDVLAVDVVG
ncbi:hypothetical protein [Nocardioides kribbensis]|uniref:Uncharacterized protein n=1 Tax=Nocardioides kribbensis TaxID=305517 RepID=A0ABV1P0P5_9ACTN